MGKRGPKPNPNLTDREREVIELVSIGKTDFEMSIILGISPSAIQTRLERACRVSDVINRTQLACKAIREGWIK